MAKCQMFFLNSWRLTVLGKANFLKPVPHIGHSQEDQDLLSPSLVFRFQCFKYTKYSRLLTYLRYGKLKKGTLQHVLITLILFNSSCLLYNNYRFVFIFYILRVTLYCWKEANQLKILNSWMITFLLIYYLIIYTNKTFVLFKQN